MTLGRSSASRFAARSSPSAVGLTILIPSCVIEMVTALYPPVVRPYAIAATASILNVLEVGWRLSAFATCNGVEGLKP